MKKLTTLTFVFMLTASMTFAQNNTAQTRQSGNDNEATVEQSGSDNYGGITQTGTHGVASIEQVGSGNMAESIRNGLPPVDQGAPAITGIQDFGDYNTGHVRQIGDNNKVQLEFTSTSDRNTVNIDQGAGGNASVNSEAHVTLKDDDNTVDLDQRGSDQYAEIRVNRNLTGDDNGAFNTVTAFQTGSKNRIDRIFVKGHNNQVDVSQDGTLNEASVQIGEGSSINGFSGNFNVVDISQNGMDHTAAATISGSGNTSTIIQNN